MKKKLFPQLKNVRKKKGGWRATVHVGDGQSGIPAIHIWWRASWVVMGDPPLFSSCLPLIVAIQPPFPCVPFFFLFI